MAGKTTNIPAIRRIIRFGEDPANVVRTVELKQTSGLRAIVCIGHDKVWVKMRNTKGTDAIKLTQYQEQFEGQCIFHRFVNFTVN